MTALIGRCTNTIGSLLDRINALRRTSNTVWAACTGRPLSSFKDFFSPMQAMGIIPDFVIIRHAYIFQLTRLGFIPHLLWNVQTRFLVLSNALRVRSAVDDWHDMITGGALGVTTVRRGKDRLCLRFDSEESASVAADMLTEKVRGYPHLRVFKYLMEVDVRAVPFTKGLAVSELARHLEIDSDHILAIGNGHNDISMLDNGVAALTGCPANSEPEVMEVVNKRGGHIATKRSLTGVMEILNAYINDEVVSELPSWFRSPSQSRNPRTGKSSHDRHKKRRVARIWLMLAVFYCVLLVFASFEIMPFSGIIMKPFDLVISGIGRLLTLF